jgi:cell division transport system ATP-binding protein
MQLGRDHNGSPIVRFDHVALQYGSQAEILRDVSFSIAPGSFHFLTGRSGAGKTSVMELIYLERPPTHGTVELFGYPSHRVHRHDRVDLRRGVGVIFQDFRLLPHLDAFENVALPLRVRGLAEDDYRDDVVELLKWVGLGERMTATPATLSGGEQQRVAIARAIVGKPELVLADEPTGNVDPELARRILRLLVEMNRHGTTIIVATHDQEMTSWLKAPILHIEEGRVQRAARFQERSA